METAMQGCASGSADGGDEEAAARRSPRTSWAHDEEQPPRACGACSCGELTCLSWAFLAFVLCIAVGIVAHNPRDAALLPGFFVAPMLVLYVVWYRKLRREIPANLVLQNFAFGFLPGACVVMLVELVLSAIFFLVCFNDQLGGWFNSATHDGGGSLRSVASAEGQWWGALALAASLRLRAPGGWAPVRRPGVDAAAAATARRTMAGRGTASAAGGHGDVGPAGAGTRAQPAVEQAVDPLAVLGKMYGITVKRTPGLYVFVFLLAYVVAAGTVCLLCGINASVLLAGISWSARIHRRCGDADTQIAGGRCDRVFSAVLACAYASLNVKHCSKCADGHGWMHGTRHRRKRSNT
jgi:hypothetical protein